jgi:hypothetical protein
MDERLQARLMACHEPVPGMSERPGFTGEMMLHARMLYLDPQEIINKLVQAQS